MSARARERSERAKQARGALWSEHLSGASDRRAFSKRDCPRQTTRTSLPAPKFQINITKEKSSKIFCNFA